MNENYLYQSPEALTMGDFVINFIAYLIGAIIMFALGKKAGNTNSWFAFVPILNYVLFFQLIGRSALNLLWYFAVAIPMVMLIAGAETLGLILLIPLVIILIILSIIWSVELFRAFGMSGWWVAALFIPFLGSLIALILMFYMAFSSNVQYVGINRNK